MADSANRPDLDELLELARKTADTPGSLGGRRCETCSRYPEGTEVHALIRYYVDRIRAGTNRASLAAYHRFLRGKAGYGMCRTSFRDHLVNCEGIDTRAALRG